MQIMARRAGRAGRDVITYLSCFMPFKLQSGTYITASHNTISTLGLVSDKHCDNIAISRARRGKVAMFWVDKMLQVAKAEMEAKS